MKWTIEDVAAAIDQRCISFKQIFARGTFVCTEWKYEDGMYVCLYERETSRDCEDGTVLIVTVPSQFTMRDVLKGMKIYSSIRHLTGWKRSEMNRRLVDELRALLYEHLNIGYFNKPRHPSCGMWRLFDEWLLYSCIREKENNFRLSFIRNKKCIAEVRVCAPDMLTVDNVRRLIEEAEIIVHQDSKIKNICI